MVTTKSKKIVRLSSNRYYFYVPTMTNIPKLTCNALPFCSATKSPKPIVDKVMNE